MNTDSKSPLKVFWEALNDESSPGMHVFMAIISNPRFNVEHLTEMDDGVDHAFGHLIVGATPLMLTLYAGRGELIETLLAAGATNTQRLLCMLLAKKILRRPSSYLWIQGPI
eukprot:GILJ01024964.1.p2 GENE.GILJ01024964.1~~GILJ01024964.1.p2  ORF type:complete len:112 (+),score=10.52 GILJ01024964.1:742-1077(+)